jgi:hypothetical protein
MVFGVAFTHFPRTLVVIVVESPSSATKRVFDSSSDPADLVGCFAHPSLFVSEHYLSVLGCVRCRGSEKS